MSITLANLRSRARDRADMQNSSFISDSELNNYINSSIAELHDLLIGNYENDYRLNSYSFTTVANTADYALPADFYKMRGVDIKITSNQWFSCRPFNFNERNRNQNFAWGLLTGPTIRYRLTDANIKFSPAPDTAVQIQIWYIPVATILSADGDTLVDINQYAEYVVVDAAIKMLQKEESDVSVLMAQKAGLIKRIQDISANRDASQPESISDIYAENDDYYFYRN